MPTRPGTPRWHHPRRCRERDRLPSESYGGREMTAPASRATAAARAEVEAALQLISDTDGAAPCEQWGSDDQRPAGGGAERKVNFYGWRQFCTNARKGIAVPTCVIDFPYADKDKEGLGLDLKGNKRLLERMYVFKDLDADTRVVVHAHTLVEWGKRGNRAKRAISKVTSVNVRHAQQAGGSFKQEPGKLSMPLVPVNDKIADSWRQRWREGRGATLEWKWEDPKSLPTGEDARLAPPKYDEVRASGAPSACVQSGVAAVRAVVGLTRAGAGQVRKIIRLGESLVLAEGGGVEETLNLSETEAKIRGAKECDVVAVDAVEVCAPASKRRALILAVETYESAALAGLQNVLTDAYTLRSTLQRLGWSAEVRANVGRNEAWAAIGAFAQEVAESGDACLLAFVGHGIEVGGNVFLLPRDCGIVDAAVDRHHVARMLRLADVQAMFVGRRGREGAGSPATMFVMDCCRNSLSTTAEARAAVAELLGTRAKVRLPAGLVCGGVSGLTCTTHSSVCFVRAGAVGR